MHRTKVWQRRKVKINHPTGGKGPQYSIVIIHPMSHYRTGAIVTGKLFQRRLPKPTRLVFDESFEMIIDMLLKIKKQNTT